MVGVEHYLIVAAALFVIGIFGIFLNRKNVIVILMSIELMLLAVNINFVAFSAQLGDLVGQVFTMFILTVAAAEAAIGLAILVVFFRNRGTIDVEDVNVMKGWPDHGYATQFADHPFRATGRGACLWLWLASDRRKAGPDPDNGAGVSGRSAFVADFPDL
jgi:NADH-quinone oxidoreductase subunit K